RPRAEDAQVIVEAGPVPALSLKVQKLFGIVFRMASATPSVATPINTNNAGTVVPNFCRTATMIVALVMNAALSTLTAAIVRARRRGPLPACTAAKAGTMNRPPATATPHRPIATRIASVDENTATGPCGDAADGAPEAASPRSIAKTPSSTAPTSVVLRTIRP